MIYINFNGVDLVFECRMLVFEWEGFGLESFQNYASLLLHTLYTLYPYIYTLYYTHSTHTHPSMHLVPEMHWLMTDIEKPYK